MIRFSAEIRPGAQCLAVTRQNDHRRIGFANRAGNRYGGSEYVAQSQTGCFSSRYTRPSRSHERATDDDQPPYGTQHRNAIGKASTQGGVFVKQILILSI